MPTINVHRPGTAQRKPMPDDGVLLWEGPGKYRLVCPLGHVHRSSTPIFVCPSCGESIPFPWAAQPAESYRR
jgi:hypothetical protein